MPLEAPVSSHLSLRRSGTLNAQRKVAQMDSCGVQQREITIKWRSGAFVPPKVRNIHNNQHSWRILSMKQCRIVLFVCNFCIIEEVSADRSGFWPPPLPQHNNTTTSSHELSTQHCPYFPLLTGPSFPCRCSKTGAGKGQKMIASSLLLLFFYETQHRQGRIVENVSQSFTFSVLRQLLSLKIHSGQHVLQYFNFRK